MKVGGGGGLFFSTDPKCLCAGVPSQCDDTHSNHDSSDDNQSSDGSQSTQDTGLVPDQGLFMSSKYERRYNWLYYSAAKWAIVVKYVSSLPKNLTISS